ncbi:unnamed protein product, partial [Effrenium voratum]
FGADFYEDSEHGRSQRRFLQLHRPKLREAAWAAVYDGQEPHCGPCHGPVQRLHHRGAFHGAEGARAVAGVDREEEEAPAQALAVPKGVFL